MKGAHHLLDEPHHDGSALYAPQHVPDLGEVVQVRVRVPRSSRWSQVWVRTVKDAEPKILPTRLDREDATDRWYVADLTIHNPVTRYRFLLADPDAPLEHVWLNGEGVHTRDVPDTADFRITVHEGAPAWMVRTVVYQVFPDRFARSDGGTEPPSGDLPEWAVPRAWGTVPVRNGPLTGKELYGGDLPGVEAHLDHLADLGVDTLYLTPVFPAWSNHRYDASTFEQIDPLLGGDDALASLSTAVHARGMRIMGDVTTNHTGAHHEWFLAAQADRDSHEAQYYYWTDDELGYAAWLDVPSLPKLNHLAPELAERLTDGPDSVVGRWMAPPYSLDGWRVDVANMTGRYRGDDVNHDVARRVRATVREMNPEGALVSEHFHDATGDLTGDGWQANMNYAAFTRPLWTWLVDDAHTEGFLGLPVRVPRRSGRDMVAQFREFSAAVPWRVTARQWNMLGSHDTPRIRTVVGSAERVRLAATMLFTLPGTPALFAGDEIGATGDNGEHGRVCMSWDELAEGGPGVDLDTLATYRELVALRRSSRALQDGGLRWVVIEDDAVAFLRETAEERLLVLVARAGWSGAGVPDVAVTRAENVFGGASLGVDAGELRLEGTGPTAQVWRLS